MMIFYASLLLVLGAARAANLDAVDLGLAGGYAILAGAAITSTGASIVTGDMGVFPGTTITFGAGGTQTGASLSGTAAVGLAQGDLTVAYNTAYNKAPTAILSNQDLGGFTLQAGVYKFDAAAALNGVLTLDAQNDPNAAW
jgi:hypothetical protein